MAGAKTLKLIQYQQTQNLLQGINAQGQLPPDQTIQSSSFTALHKLRTDFNQRALMRSHLETLIEVLGEHEKQTGIPDSLKSEYSRLLNRINLDPGKVSLSEFENAIKKFSSNNEYTNALQNEINKNPDLEINPEELAEPSSSSGIVDSSEPVQKSEEDQASGQQSGGQEESSDNQQTRQTPRREPQRVQPREKKSAEEKSIDRHNRKMEKRKPENIEERGESRKERRKKRRLLRKQGGNQASGYNPLGNKLNNWAKNKFNNSRFGKAFNNSRFGRGLTRINNLLNAPSRFLNNIASRIGNRFLSTNLGQGLSRIGNLLNAPSRFLSRLGSQALRGALNLGSQAARFLINSAARALSQLASQAAGGAARAAIGTAGRGLVAGIAAIGVTGALIIVLVIVVAIGIFWLYDSNSECGQPGTIEMTKFAKKDSVVLGENIEFQINITYKIKCSGGYASAVVRDRVPLNTTYNPGSAKSTSLQLGGLIPIPGAGGVLDGDTLVWQFNKLVANDTQAINFSVTPNQDNVWIGNQATVTYRPFTGGFLGQGAAGTTGLIPSSPPPPDWENIKTEIIAAFTRHDGLIDVYKEASAQSGVPWQVIAGLHYVENGNNPRPGTSLVSGRAIGQVEPDISPVKCAAGVTGPGIPIPIGGGCGFASQTESMIYGAKLLSEKIGKVPSTFEEVVKAASKYNGGGNANCGEGLPYGPCPPPSEGQDDPYAIADFDAAHSSDTMYLLFGCGDGTKCSPRIFGRPGVMGVVRALDEERL